MLICYNNLCVVTYVRSMGQRSINIQLLHATAVLGQSRWIKILKMAEIKFNLVLN